MSLQVTSDLVVLITQSVLVVFGVGVQQQAGRLNRPSRDDHCFRARNVRLSFAFVFNETSLPGRASLLQEVRHTVDVAAVVSLDPIGYGAGYDAAKMHAMSLLNGDKTYAFVTDKVDGYLFIEPWAGQLPAIETVGIKLVGLTSVSDFDWYDVITG